MDFSVNRTLHVNAMVVWLLYGFLVGVYWMLEDEAGHPVVALGLGHHYFWIGTPPYWLTIGGSLPALGWTIAQAAGNCTGAGVWAFSLGYVLLVWDLLSIGKREARPAVSMRRATPLPEQAGHRFTGPA